MGAVVDGDAPVIVRNEDVIDSAGIGETEFKAVCDRELAEIERRRRRYLGSRPESSKGGSQAYCLTPPRLNLGNVSLLHHSPNA